ncbi:MAG: preprotein translocase subunit SecG [Chromatiales bacterium]|jgi:preprotein translocase subunit SecG
METILTVVHLFLAIGLVALVLMQHGKGADAGAAFGSGASATVFGAAGSANFLSRATAIFATLFFITSLSLAYFAMQSTEPQSLMDDSAPAPAAPAPQINTDLPLIPGTEVQTPESDMPSIATPAEPMTSDITAEDLGIPASAANEPAAADDMPAVAAPVEAAVEETQPEAPVTE